MSRYIGYISTVIPVFVIANNEDEAYDILEENMREYWENNYDLETALGNACVEFIEYDSEYDSDAVENEENSMKEKVMKAAIKFLENKEYSIIYKGDSAPFDIICQDLDGVTAFIDVDYDNGNMREATGIKTRSEFELGVAQWMETHEIDSSCTILRYDTIDMNIAGNQSKALLRYHINVYGKEKWQKLVMAI